MAFGSVHRKLGAALRQAGARLSRGVRKASKTGGTRKQSLSSSPGQHTQHVQHKATGHHHAEGHRAHAGRRAKAPRGHIGRRIHAPKVKHEHPGRRTSRKRRFK